jgi:hypothetical protein
VHEIVTFLALSSPAAGSVATVSDDEAYQPKPAVYDARDRYSHTVASPTLVAANTYHSSDAPDRRIGGCCSSTRRDSRADRLLQ